MVPFIEECLNEVYHETTEFTPIELQLDIKPTRFWEKWLVPRDRDDIPNETKIALAKDRIKRKGQARADRINKKGTSREYNVGDTVLVKTCNLSNAEQELTSKFLALYEGPYIITHKEGSATRPFSPVPAETLPWRQSRRERGRGRDYTNKLLKNKNKSITSRRLSSQGRRRRNNAFANYFMVTPPRVEKLQGHDGGWIGPINNNTRTPGCGCTTALCKSLSTYQRRQQNEKK